ncbi:hypothetical protein [Brasilonema sp. UFV-L1]|uniref:hypothetical protein n=1 Tax=Brasilonema sp. UFV-L1 TaxID=2234130 RepID=UPI00145F9731|nr:hypothetical protein [Brasilonema sp. UFV-L1]NMG10356.1 hypothetical protein [Brasilonema sp. UFV-L1]
MTQPIGYFTNYDPTSNEGLLAEMQEAWGATFEALSNVDRMWMVWKLAEQLTEDFEQQLDIQDLNHGVAEAIDRHSGELSTGDRLGLILALVHQVQHNYRGF